MHSRITMQEKWNHAPTQRFHINVPSNGIQNSQKVETTQITTTCLRDEHNVAYPYDGNLFSNFFKNKALIPATTWWLLKTPGQPRTSCCTIPFTWNVHNKEIHRDGSRAVVPRDWGTGKRAVTAYGFFGGWWECSGIRPWWWVHNSTELHIVRVDFTVRELHRNLWF